MACSGRVTPLSRGDTKMPETCLTRRRVLTCGCGLTLASVATGCSSEPVMGPEKPIASLSELDVNIPVQFTYPDEEVAFLIDLGRKVEGGVGPDESIVAYSGLCQHMGTPVEYKADRGQFVCPAHVSVFDALRKGTTVEGSAPTSLPRILLKVVQRRVYAIGVQEGIIYGRASNQKF